MNARAKYVSTQVLVLLLSVSVLFAQETVALAPAPMQTKPVFTQQQLDQMLAPVALYPDSLLSQILMASTYPLEIVEASRWSKANPNLRGDDAVKAAEQNGWDPSVTSLVAFPQVLTMMDSNLSWTERLGDAFLAQQPQVMETVQNLRQRAYAAGNLRSNDQVRVDQQGQTIVIEPPNPQVVYVPYYDPRVVYGPWWWPEYPPVYWGPWPGYYVPFGFGAGFAWGVGITVGAGFFFGAFDWPHRHIRVIPVNNFYYRNNVVRVWEHDPVHRLGVPYRGVELRQRFGRMSAAPEARRDFRGRRVRQAWPVRRMLSSGLMPLRASVADRMCVITAHAVMPVPRVMRVPRVMPQVRLAPPMVALGPSMAGAENTSRKRETSRRIWCACRMK